MYFEKIGRKTIIYPKIWDELPNCVSEIDEIIELFEGNDSGYIEECVAKGIKPIGVEIDLESFGGKKLAALKEKRAYLVRVGDK